MVAVACLLFAFVYPPFDVGTIALVAVAPVALVLLDPSLRCSLAAAAGSGLAFGWLAALMIVGPWMYQAAAQYFDKPATFAAAFTVAVNGGYVAVFYAALFALLRLLAAASPVQAVLGTASLWTGLEYVRAAAAGNAWALLGQGLHDVPVLREAAGAGGVWLLTWACALTGAAIGVALRRDIDARARRLAIDLAVAGPVVLALLAWATRPAPAGRALLPLRVAGVQADIAGTDLWKPELRMAHLQRYVEMTRELEPGRVDLVVWPENAVPLLLDADKAVRERLADLARTLGSALLVGAPRSSSGGDGTARFFNSAWLFAPDGSVAHYDKLHLLPYIETSPAFMPVIAPSAQYDEGDGVVLFDVAGWRVAPLICLEAIHPGYARAAAMTGADVFVNISNDAWFGAGYGPEQHHVMSVLRAAESRRPMVRVANGGVTGAVDARGAPIGERSVRSTGVRLFEVAPADKPLSFFHRWGDWAAWAALVHSALLCGHALRRRRQAANRAFRDEKPANA